MLLGRASVGCGHCIEEKRSRGEIDNRRAGDAYSTNETGAWQISLHQRRAKIALPDDAAIVRIKCVHIIRLGHCNDRRSAARAAVDVKWLRVNRANDCTAEVQVPRKIGSGCRRERSINVKTIPGGIVVKLSDVYLRVCRKNSAPDDCSNNR